MTIAPEIGSRWQYRNGSYYTVINNGHHQTEYDWGDMEPVVIYEAESDHSVWTRPTDQFLDGRFIRVPLP